jgi:YHS domain-containing protein
MFKALMFALAVLAAAGGSALAETSAASVSGEFGNSCAMGLARGEQIDTDCSINWKAANGKVYCFGSEESREAFLKDPEENARKAGEFYAELKQATRTDKQFTEAEVTAAVKAAIAERTQDGVFVFHDPKLGRDLRLVFDKVRIVRGMHGYGWFPNVIFRDADEAEKMYAIDFWFRPHGDKLNLVDIRVQKAPRRDGDGWIMITRLPVAWWWLPVSEHPGDMEVVRHWHVMSAIHSEVAARRNEDGVYFLKDEKTGQTIPLEFVEIHQPIRRLKKDGRYFACTDFRKKGSKDEYYDVDFWLEDKDGKLQVREVRIHKVPVQEDGIWHQQSRYNFDGLDIEDVK